MRETGGLRCGLWLTMTTAAGIASAQELPVEIGVRQVANLPAEPPRLTLVANAPVRELRVEVREGDRPVVQRGLGSLGAGGRRELVWSAPPGEHSYVIAVRGRTDDGRAEASVEALVTVMRPLEVLLPRDQVDLTAREFFITMNNPSGQVELAIANSMGRVVHEATIDLAGQPAGARLRVTWPELGEPIGRIDVRVFDAAGAWQGFELAPFVVNIPHEDVVFETNKWEIRAAEADKLDEAYARILEAIAEHGADLKAGLYVLGHTDTVGSGADNKVLSLRRARAIAESFRARGGITLPIYAAGFGETQLAQKTQDNVDEAKNRRAEYILAAQAPVAGDWVTISAGR